MTIELAGIELYGFHGVLEEERTAGQRFVVDLEVDPTSAAAAASDDLDDAIDYRKIVAVVVDVSDGRQFRLLEALAGAIADRLLAELPADRVRVRVRKPEVRLEAAVEHAAVVVERARVVRRLTT